MISVACVWVKGNVPYTADYVTRLYSMVARHLDAEFEFTVFTDRPDEVSLALADMPAVKRFEKTSTVKIPSPAPLAGWWSKLELFNPARARALGARVLYLDLDVLVVGDLAPLIDFKVDGRASPFALAPPGGNFKPKGYRTVTRYNSSVMVFEPSAHLARLYTDFRPGYALAERHKPPAPPYWGDQDWIGEREPGADVMPAAWFPRLGDTFALPRVGSVLTSSPLDAARERGARVILVKKPKPHVAADNWPWFAEAWR